MVRSFAWPPTGAGASASAEDQRRRDAGTRDGIHLLGDALTFVLAAAPDSAILMHPLPRKHEMGTEADHAILDDDPRSVYFHQMQNGMFVRMALLAAVLGATE